MEQYRAEIYPDPGNKEDEKSNNSKRFIIDFVETIALSVILFLGINFISARIRVESISMQPTLYAGNFVIVNKLAYKIGQPARGDIIVFHYPPDPQREPYIKRVIGLPGDQISVNGGFVYINGEPLGEPYINAQPNYQGNWVISDGELFVLGDNRNRSSDSHSWGTVPLENVIGKALVVYWPPESWKLLDYNTAIAAPP
jgi:signal peptidase I